MRNILFLGVIMIGSVCCSTHSAQTQFGTEFEATDVITVEQLVASLEESETVSDVVVKGTVVDVCKVKGCWMTLQRDSGDAVRVTFKDYGFFVPKDIHERTVLMKGKGEIVITPVEELQHYAEDDGQSKEEIAKITEPKQEFVFEAEGVVLVD